MTFSKHKSLKNLDRVCARFMGQHTRAVMPTIKNKESARAFVLHLDDRARVLLKDQLHEIEKREVLDYLHEEIDQIEAGIRAAHEGKYIFVHFWGFSMTKNVGYLSFFPRVQVSDLRSVMRTFSDPRYV